MDLVPFQAVPETRTCVQMSMWIVYDSVVLMQYYFLMLWCTCYTVCSVQRTFEDDEDEKVETNLAKKFFGLLWIFSAKQLQ